MKKWEVYAQVTGSKYLGTVEAETREEAESKAWELDSCYISLCHQCESECEDADIQELTLYEEE